jgi:hypothetical protein
MTMSTRFPISAPLPPIHRAFALPLRLVHSATATKVYDAEHCVIAIFYGRDHKAQARLAIHAVESLAAREEQRRALQSRMGQAV